MEQYVFWIITLVGGILVSLPFAIIGYYLKGTMSEIKTVKDLTTDNKETIISIKGRLDLVENNHNHLASEFHKLYDAIKDLTIEIKGLHKEIAKKKDI